jgi:hypothetical protein
LPIKKVSGDTFYKNESWLLCEFSVKEVLIALYTLERSLSYSFLEVLGYIALFPLLLMM